LLFPKSKIEKTTTMKLLLLLSLLLLCSVEAAARRPSLNLIISQHHRQRLFTTKRQWIATRTTTSMIPRGGDDSSTTTAETITTEEEVSTTTDDDSIKIDEVVVVDDSTTTTMDPVITTATAAAASTLLIPSLLKEIGIDFKDYMKGSKLDVMLLLLTTAFNAPLCQRVLKISPILGFLGLGLLLGPNGQNLISDIHTIEVLADMGIVMFLFDMGLHIDVQTLLSMKKDVFGIGFTQFVSTAVIIGTLFCGSMPGAGAKVIIGWSLALSSSAFVLQLLKDKKIELNKSQYGKSSFGTLLLQDLMVVPLLVLTPLLAPGKSVSIKTAICKALLQLGIALSILLPFGKFALKPLFEYIFTSSDKESKIGMVLSLVLGCSFLTEGLGLSNTLGPFLIGMLVAETTTSELKHRIEQEASPIRGILVGLFFFTVGFEIDINLIRSKFAVVSMTVIGLVLLKTVLTTLSCLLYGIPFPTAQRVGWVLSQGGEFAFVAFRTARSYGILSEEQTKFLLTVVSLTMTLTPFVEDLGTYIATSTTTSNTQNDNDDNDDKKIN